MLAHAVRLDGDGRVSGLIDFGDAMVGDAKYESVAVYLSALDFDRLALDACLTAYGHRDAWDGYFEHRLMAYMLLHAFPVPLVLPPARRDEMCAAEDLDAAAEALWGWQR